jgi:hypothetical protein
MANPIETLREHPAVTFVAVVVLAVAAWLVHSAVVVTEKDLVKQTIGGVAESVAAQDATAVLTHFSSAYDDGSLTHESMSHLLPGVLALVKINHGSWRFVDPPEIDAEHRRASIRILVRSGVSIEAVGRAFPVTSIWAIDLERPGEAWRVTSADPVEINMGGRDFTRESGLRALMLRAISESRSGP